MASIPSVANKATQQQYSYSYINSNTGTMHSKVPTKGKLELNQLKYLSLRISRPIFGCGGGACSMRCCSWSAISLRMTLARG